MEVEVDGVKYEVSPVPPHLSPFLTRIGELLRAKPESLEEAERNSEEIARAMVKLFSGTVTPAPALKHQTQVFNALVNLTSRTIEDAQFFRGSGRPGASQGCTAQLSTASATQQAAGREGV